VIESPVFSEGMHAGEPDNETTALVLYSDNEEAVEWLNMCWRKVGRQPSDMCIGPGHLMLSCSISMSSYRGDKHQAYPYRCHQMLDALGHCAGVSSHYQYSRQLGCF